VREAKSVLDEDGSESYDPVSRWSALLARLRRVVGRFPQPGVSPTAPQAVPPACEVPARSAALPVTAGSIALAEGALDLWPELSDPTGPGALLSGPFRPPLVTFRTPGGALFWPIAIAPDDRVTLDGSVRRAFVIRSRADGDCVCFVEISRPVRGLVAVEAGRDFSAEDPLWDILCRSALADVLCSRTAPPEAAIVLHRLGFRQMEIVRRARYAPRGARGARRGSLPSRDGATWFLEGE
jgi:hypothetical protein